MQPLQPLQTCYSTQRYLNIFNICKLIQLFENDAMREAVAAYCLLRGVSSSHS